MFSCPALPFKQNKTHIRIGELHTAHGTEKGMFLQRFQTSTTQCLLETAFVTHSQPLKRGKFAESPGRDSAQAVTVEISAEK